MNLTYDQIHAIYFHGNNCVAVDRAVENKYKVKVGELCRCMNCGWKLPRTSWLCPDNDHKCIIAFFNNNPEVLVEAITHET